METGYYISKKDYDTIINYAQVAYDTMKSEIGGMSICYQDKDGDWIVTDPVIIKQEVTGSTCDLDKDELANYYCKAAKKHAKKNFRFCWWHSHHTMGVFWSPTDVKGIDEYSDGDFSFALVVNLKRQNKFRISMWNPIIMHEDTELLILDEKKPSISKKILEEVKELCDKPVTVYTTNWKDPRYNNTHQSNIFQNEYLGYNSGYGYSYGDYAESRINYGTDKKALPSGQMHTYCYGKLVDWMDDLANGKLTYEEYSRQVDKANEELELMKSPCMFVKISMAELTENIEWEDPEMWIRTVTYEEEKEERTNGVSTK